MCRGPGELGEPGGSRSKVLQRFSELREGEKQLFRGCNGVVVIGPCGVPLEHGKFGIVHRAQLFSVAEAPDQLKDISAPFGQEFFHVEFGGGQHKEGALTASAVKIGGFEELYGRFGNYSRGENRGFHLQIVFGEEKRAYPLMYAAARFYCRKIHTL